MRAAGVRIAVVGVGGRPIANELAGLAGAVDGVLLVPNFAALVAVTMEAAELVCASAALDDSGEAGAEAEVGVVVCGADVNAEPEEVRVVGVTQQALARELSVVLGADELLLTAVVASRRGTAVLLEASAFPPQKIDASFTETAVTVTLPSFGDVVIKCFGTADTGSAATVFALPFSLFVGASQSATSPDSCMQRCGKLALSKRCGCDALCIQMDDCCEDFVAACTTNSPTLAPSRGPTPFVLPTPAPTVAPTRSPTSALETCKGRCGDPVAAADTGCSCDANCQDFGDCCLDYTRHCTRTDVDVSRTCAGSCGLQAKGSPSMLPTMLSDACWCDAACSDNKDCCLDYTGACEVSGSVPPSAFPAPAPAPAPSSCVGRCEDNDPVDPGLLSCDYRCGQSPADLPPFPSVSVLVRGLGTRSVVSMGEAKKVLECRCDGACRVFGDCCQDYRLVCGGGDGGWTGLEPPLLGQAGGGIYMHIRMKHPLTTHTRIYI
jgi:hypothetical protein